MAHQDGQPTFTASSDVRVYSNFEEMDLIPEQLLRGIFAYGFEKPSEIQKRGIMPIAQGSDVLAQAQSGTGKTATFTIGSLCRVDPTLNEVQVLVIVPTHELAKQIYDVAVGLGNYYKIKAHAARGKHPIKYDIDAIQSGCHFLVGTPGRIYDLCHRGILNREHIKVVIMDEADHMLQGKFHDQSMHILKLGFPNTTRMALFSATWSPDIVKLTDDFLQEPVRILIEKPSEVPLQGIRQYYVHINHEEWKFDTLCDIYSQLTINQCMIFCNKQARADWLAMKMKDANFTLECLHGGMSAEERDKKMEDFRKGSCRVLITTDLAARGIDVQQVEMVINFDVPADKANYIHRIGRAARYGRKGVTINLVGPSDLRMQKDIEVYWNTNWEPLPEDLSRVGV
jgi:translation initiation factor 4A